jgi:hypothetical protein
MEEQIKNLQRGVHEQVLQRAEADPQWRRQLLDDPDTATSSIPETRQLQELLSLPGAPRSIAAGGEYRQLTRSLTETILDRAASDPLWREKLLEDPEAALQEANLPELQRLEELPQSEEVVRGQLGKELTGLYGDYVYYYTYSSWCCRLCTYRTYREPY